MTRTSKGRLSDFEKGQIVALAEKNCPLSEIQAQVNRSKSTIHEFLQRFRERGSEENLPTSGRPPKLSASTRRLPVRRSKKDRQQPLRELRNEVAPQVSVRTVKRALQQENIRKWRAKKRALLKPQHAADRLAWALKHQDWDKKQWGGVIFTDECSVEKTKDPRGVWVF